jgi:hypothetical protein
MTGRWAGMTESQKSKSQMLNVNCQLSIVKCQLSIVKCQMSIVSFDFLLGGVKNLKSVIIALCYTG